MSLASTKPADTVAMPLRTIVGKSLFWDFEFRSLDLICVLVFGAWNFRDLAQQVYICETGQKLD